MEQQENEFLKQGNDCFFNIIKSYQQMIKTISQDISKGGYPSMSNLKVQSEIVKVIQNFEQLQIIMNESMQKCSCNEELVREQKLRSYHSQLKSTKQNLATFFNDLESIKIEGEVLLAKCERKCAMN